MIDGMLAIDDQPDIGMGLYTPQEAALYAKLRTDTFNRWFFGDRRGAAVLQPRLRSSDRIITFWDLVQALAVRTLRRSRKTAQMPLQRIREVVEQCHAKGITFPLARRHTLYWYSDRLILRDEDDHYIGLAAGIDKNQLYHAQIIEPFLQEIDFGSDRLARSWTPLRGPEFRIDLNSERRFGMPIVEPGGILVSALVDAVESEGSIAAAAEAFETKEDAVLLALKYETEYLASAA